MEALEFSTQIINGAIQVPQELNGLQNTAVKVIVLYDKAKQMDTKEQLKDIFNKLNASQTFNAVEDVIAWQNKQRDEWT
jgi:hypothetical protein